MPRARTSARRENQLISMAYDLAEQQIRNGTVSAQVLAQCLKLGSSRARLESEILAEQKKLVSAKTESLESQKEMKELYTNAMNAMRRYSGAGGPEEYEDV